MSEHFKREEFEIDGAFPDACLPVVNAMCDNVLEPIRAHVQIVDSKTGAPIEVPIIITSGYRAPEVNAEVHGAKQSQHEYTEDTCACDWKIPGLLRPVFDWIREESKLPVDQVILEHGPNGDIIHTSYVLGKPPRQEALEGLTGNRSGYMQWRFNK